MNVNFAARVSAIFIYFVNSKQSEILKFWFSGVAKVSHNWTAAGPPPFILLKFGENVKTGDLPKTQKILKTKYRLFALIIERNEDNYTDTFTVFFHQQNNFLYNRNQATKLWTYDNRETDTVLLACYKSA